MKLQINEEYLTDTTSFSWSMTAGVSAHKTTFLVPHETAKKLFESGTFGSTLIAEQGEDKLEIKNLSVIESGKADYLKSYITLVDPRWFLRYLMVSSRYNIKRLTPKFEIMKGAAGIARDYWMFPKYAYRSWSTKKAERPSWQDYTPGGGTPYTTLEIADILMTKLKDDYEFPYGGIKKSKNFIESSPDEMDFSTQPLTAVLQRLFDYCGGELGFFEDGKVYIYSNEDKHTDMNDDAAKLLDLQKEIQPESVTSKLYIKDFSKYRPKKIKIIFKKEHEVLIDTYKNNAEKFNANIKEGYYESDEFRQNPRLKNVMKLPLNIIVAGRTYLRGEYVPISLVLQHLDTTEKELRFAWRTPQYLHVYAAEKTGLDINTFMILHPIKIQMLLTAKNNLDRVYQIDPAWIEQVISLVPKRASVADWVTKTRQPSEVFNNYTYAIKMRAPARMLKNELGKYGADIDDAPIDGADDEYTATKILKKYEEGKCNYSPFSINIIDAQQGIISFSIYEDLQRQIIDVMISQLENTPSVSVQFKPDFWARCHLKEDNRKVCAISAVFATPNTEKQYHVETLDLISDKLIDENKKCEYPYMWIIPTVKLTARYDYNQILVDADIIKQYARSEARRLLRDITDRLMGTVTLGGKINVALFGRCESVTYLFQQGGIKTRVAMRPSIPRRELYSLLTKYRRKVFGQLQDIE